jgi:PAS domain S-box-containing protein
MAQSGNKAVSRALAALRGWTSNLWPRPRASEASRSLNWHLGVATLKVVLPLIAVALVMVAWIAHSEMLAKDALLVSQSRALGDAVALRVDRYLVLAGALSHSSWLQRADLDGFEQQARETLAGMSDVTLLVSAPDGHPLLSIPPTPGDSPLWRDRAGLMKQALNSRAPFLSGVSADAASHEAHVSVEAGVFRDGGPVYEIALVLPSTQFQDLLKAQNLPDGWLLAIVDREGNFIARTPARPTLAGKPASQEFRLAARRPPNAIVSHDSIEGVPILSAYTVLPNGWTVGVATASDRFAVGPSAFLFMLALAGVALAASLLLSFLSSRRLARQMGELQTKAAQVFAGSFVAPTPMGVREFDELAQAMARASRLLAERADRQRGAEEDQRKSEEHFRVLADSLPQLVWTAGPDGRIDYANIRRERYGTGALNALDWGILIHPEDRRATAETWLRANEAGEPYEMEHRLLVVEKGYLWHLSRAIPVLDATGAVACWYGTTTDIHDQKLREENVTFLMTEVNHRSRNLLAVALAIARRTATSAETAPEFEKKFSERLLGLIANQDLLIGRNWRGVPLGELVLAQVTAPPAEREGHFSLDGPEILLNPNAAQTLGLALRELFNNAVSYGAFSNDRGAVAVSWRIDESGEVPMLDLTWREREGPTVKPHQLRGFGSVLIERMVADGLDASAVLDFAPEGVTWRVNAPLKEVLTRWELESASMPQA